MTKQTIGIIGAMEEEVSKLLENMKTPKQVEVHGIPFLQGECQGVPVVLCTCGVGKGNAAITAMTLVNYFEVDQIFFTGVAGALDPDLDIGDIVISQDCQYHDLDVRALGFEQGVIPFQEVSIFPADQNLIEWAQKACTDLEGVKVRVGRVLTGDQFISDQAKSRFLHEELKGSCVEMEGAAVAHVAYVTNRPYVVIRSISDRADQSAHVNFEEFTQLASDRSSYVVQRLLEQIGKMV
ncbi:5'-methylthioadenosine/adenosylhomocysteine nucleosidase [Risungbinella massiliensis]|uniref:5'-methylthioadenosine/adenosylhomocysteine nucleosidase n=1 Tax=Risungbinella massiliensis TaxID=1329796 RepID=UPI0005CBC5D2|nr:5'-methylthioadenosine/adenosylhomocysteine nucleosidase [Risungbinella massiliensis]